MTKPGNNGDPGRGPDGVSPGYPRFVGAKVGPHYTTRSPRSLPLDSDYVAGIAERRQRAQRFIEQQPTASPEAPTAVEAHLADTMAFAESGNTFAALEAAHLICDVKTGLLFGEGKQWRRLIGGDIVSQTGIDGRALTDAVRILLEHDEKDHVLEILQRYKAPGFCLPTLRRFQNTGAPCAEAAEYLRALEELRDQVDGLGGPASPDYVRSIHAVRRAGKGLLEVGEALRERDPILQARMGGVVRADDLIDALPSADPLAILDFLVGGDGTVGVALMTAGNDVDVVPVMNDVFNIEHVQELMQVYGKL